MSQKPRVYDQWAGNEKGTPENKTRCVAEVRDYTGWHRIQCSRKRGFGPNAEYCKQHAKKLEGAQCTCGHSIANHGTIGNSRGICMVPFCSCQKVQVK